MFSFISEFLIIIQLYHMNEYDVWSLYPLKKIESDAIKKKMWKERKTSSIYYV